MNAKRLFEDDDDLFADPDDSRPSHVEIKIDRFDATNVQTVREGPAAVDYLSRIPRLTMNESELTELALDHREGFLLSEVDGQSTLEDILDVCPMESEEVLALIDSLVARGILVLA